MSAKATEIKKRTEIALAAIKSVHGTPDDEFGVTLFVSHHLEELDEVYWNKHLQTASPDPVRVLDILKLKSHWGDEDDDGIDNFDFTLPDEVTNYVLCVRFDDDGEVEEISMES